jgi:ferredoxin
MPHVITSLCLRDCSCTKVCPVDCISPGNPVDQWPTYYIDPDACIDCDACSSECPYHAIFSDDEVPTAFTAKGGELLSAPEGTPGFDQSFNGTDSNGKEVHLKGIRILKVGEVVDLTSSIAKNADFYQSGPGYQ